MSYAKFIPIYTWIVRVWHWVYHRLDDLDGWFPMCSMQPPPQPSRAFRWTPAWWGKRCSWGWSRDRPRCRWRRKPLKFDVLQSPSLRLLQQNAQFLRHDQTIWTIRLGRDISFTASCSGVPTVLISWVVSSFKTYLTKECGGTDQPSTRVLQSDMSGPDVFSSYAWES